MAVKQIKRSDIINMIMEGVICGSKRGSGRKNRATNDAHREAIALEVYQEYMFSIRDQVTIVDPTLAWITEVEDCISRGAPLTAIKIFKNSQKNPGPSLKEAKDAIWKYKETRNWNHWRFK